MKNDFVHLKYIKLEQLHDKNISIFIGADEPHLDLYRESRIGNTNEPVALVTTLGWVLMGGKSNNSKISTSFFKWESEMLDKSIERFWQTDSYGILKRDDTILMPKQDRKAIEILESTVNKKNNHYTVGLLWKDENIILPYNRSTALSRFHSLEKRSAKNPTIAIKYKDTINDYIEKGHTTKLSDERLYKILNITNYIQHHYVLQPNKPGKVRVVFDAAAKHNNISLNEKLLKGSDLLNSLIGLLMRFRKGEYAVMTDIEKMFHQIYVLEKDRDALRFLWRDKPTDKICDYITNVYLFGKIDSPCCASWSVKKTATNQANNYCN